MKLLDIAKFTLAMIGLILLLSSCGGGGSAAAPQFTINGVAQAGVFNGATVRIYGFDAAGMQVCLETVPAGITTDSNGRFHATVNNYTGAVVVKVFGTFRDEASGKEITIPESTPMQAALPSVSGDINVPVTPLTDLAVRKAVENGGIRAGIVSANQAISTLFGVDIVNTIPTPPTITALQDSGATDSQKRYTTVLTALSQYTAAISSTPATPTATDINSALAQISAGITITGANPQVTSNQVAYNLQQASAALTTNSNTKDIIAAAGSVATSTLASLSTTGINSGSRILAVRLRAFGNYSGIITGIQANITLPSGATVRTGAASGVIAAGAVAATGNAAGASASGRISSGILTFGIISGGFTIGEFATIYCDVPASSQLTAADFSNMTNIIEVNTAGAPIAGITLSSF